MKKSILVVEDDNDIRQSLVEILQEEGYTVLSALNGKEGLEVLKKAEPLPGLVILDIMMPVLDGYGFRLEQMKSPRLASVPTALFSANGRLDEKARKVGVTEFLKKPIDLNKLFDLANKYCV